MEKIEFCKIYLLGTEFNLSECCEVIVCACLVVVVKDAVRLLSGLLNHLCVKSLRDLGFLLPQTLSHST